MFEQISGGWPQVLSSLKSYLEAGTGSRPGTTTTKGRRVRRAMSGKPQFRLCHLHPHHAARSLGALIEPEFTRQYLVGIWQSICDWKPGSPWRIMFADGRVADSGEILEIDPPKRLVLTWRNEFRPGAEGRAIPRLTYELETAGRYGASCSSRRHELSARRVNSSRRCRAAGPRSVQSQEPAGNRRVAGSDPQIVARKPEAVRRAAAVKLLKAGWLTR